VSFKSMDQGKTMPRLPMPRLSAADFPLISSMCYKYIVRAPFFRT
jgi:hypothetical protein